MSNFVRRVRPEKTGVRAPLGDLEMAIMRHAWACGAEGCLGTEVQQVLEQERPIALTTVLTTLDRLRDKGILERERVGKAYRYRPVLSEEQVQQRIVEGVLGALIAQFPRAVAAYFTQQQGLSDAVGADTPQALADLARRLETMNPADTDTDDHA